MAIPNYNRPRAEVYQQLNVYQTDSGRLLGACIVGANYDLYRYGKETLPAYQFTGSTQTLPFTYEKNPLLDYKVDESSAAVYAENLEAVIGESGLNDIMVEVNNIFTLYTQSDDMLVAKLGELSPSQNLVIPDYNIHIGDIIYVTTKFGTYRSVVTELLGTPIPATTVASVISGDAGVNVTANDTYTGTVDTTYVVEIISKNGNIATYRVTDTAGIDTSYTATLDTTSVIDTLTLGHGVTLSLEPQAAPITVGTIYAVTCTAASASTTEFKGLRASSALIPAIKATNPDGDREGQLVVHRAYTGQLASSSNGSDVWKIGTDTNGTYGVILNGGASLLVDGKVCPFAANTGDLFLEFRVMVIPDEDEDLFTLTNEADIEAAFGTIDPANELAFACACCLAGVTNREFYALRVRSTDEDGFLEAVKKTATNKRTYSFVPITDDVNTIIALSDYGLSLSTPEVKKWRRVVCGVEAPGAYTIATIDNSSKPLAATIVPYSNSGYLLQLAPNTNFDFRNITFNNTSFSILPGDKIVMPATGGEYTVRRVLSATELLLVDGPTGGITTNQLISLVKADTPENSKQYIISIAKGLATRRATVVWCDGGQGVFDGVTTKILNKFLAAEIAGLSSSVQPQKSLTRSVVNSITKASRMYNLYTQADLNEIASNGVLIVTQDTKDTSCYIRHQLTTETDKGLLYYEESFTRNLDNISYGVDEVVEAFVGKANIVTLALRVLHAKITDKLTTYTQDSEDDLVGPSMTSFEDLTVEQDKLLLDTININVKYYLNGPMNVIKVYQVGYVAQVSI